MEFIMPLLQLLVGWFSLLVDPKDKGKRWILILVGILLIGSAGAAIYLNTIEERQHREERDQDKTQLIELREANQRLEGYLLVLLRGFGFIKKEPTREEIAQSIEANRNLQELQARSRTTPGITVEYFQKDVDAQAVADELSQLGFRFQVKQPVNDLPTNAIWVGDKITVEDAQKVALALIRAGVQLHSVARFHVGAGPKSLLIQVGADPGIISWPALTVSDIISMKQLKRFPS